MDLGQFEKAAKRNEPALTKFLKKMDDIVPPDLDELVKVEDEKVWEKIDCTTCANCCKTMTPIYLDSDISRISKHLGMPEKEFFDKYLEVEADTGNTINNALPCVFLVNNMCSIYEVRPIDCAEFPHHDKRPFDDYNDTYIQNLHHCPATYELVKNLKVTIEREYDF